MNVCASRDSFKTGGLRLTFVDEILSENPENSKCHWVPPRMATTYLIVCRGLLCHSPTSILAAEIGN